ncbi:MAG: NADH-quinone oxidoreductase subunit NuoN [Rhodospirillales bacterium]
MIPVMHDPVPALGEIWLAFAAMALLMLGAFRKRDSTRICMWLAVGALAFAGVLTVAVTPARGVVFHGQFVADHFALFMKLLVLGGSALTLVMSQEYARREGMARFEYPVLVLFATLGMMMMVSANDLISLYIGLELQSLSLYVVAAFKRDEVRSTEAGLKYFVLGALSSGMLLYGCSLVYGFAGSTNFAVLAKLFQQGAQGAAPVGLIVGLMFVMAGLAFKVSAVPFHMWTPDVYEGAPTPVTAFFSVAPKIAAIALFTRVMTGPFGPLMLEWRQIVVVVAIASMILGALAAINQTSIKRLMAYSSIGHVGYARVGLAAGTPAGVRGVLIYMATYLFMNLGAFACILSMKRQGRMVETISDLAGLARSQPKVAYAFAIFLLSLIGLPPLAGFFGKLFVFLAAIEAGLYTLAVIGMLASVVGAYYYIRIVQIMFMDEPAQGFDRPEAGVAAVMGLSAAVTLLFFVFCWPVFVAAEAAAKSLSIN